MIRRVVYVHVTIIMVIIQCRLLDYKLQKYDTEYDDAKEPLLC